MTVCQLLECKHNNRLNTPYCKREGIPENDDKGCCIHIDIDHDYRRAQGRERDKQRPWLKPNAGKVKQ